MIEGGTESIRVEVGTDRVATLTIDVPGQAANTMSAGFKAELRELVPRLRAARDTLAGVVITSAKKTFFAGGDLRTLMAVQPSDAQGFHDGLEVFKSALRGLEQLGLPVAVAINGAALGGGWEICLCAHARFSLDDDKLLLGLPEASLGLLPGAGGVSRMVRKLGLRQALPLLLEGQTFTPAQALTWGLLDGTAADLKSVLALARQWVLAHPQPRVAWDDPGFAVPGLERDLRQIALHGPADLFAKGQGCYPARRAVLAAAVEGAMVDIDTALRLETRYLTSLAIGQVAKNMIGTFFFQSGQLKSGRSRPVDIERTPTQQVRLSGFAPPMLAAALASAARRMPVAIQVATPEVQKDALQAIDAATRRLVDTGRMSPARAQAARAGIEVVQGGDGGGFEGIWLVEQTSDTASGGILLLSGDATETPAIHAGRIGLRAWPDVHGATVVEVVRGQGCDAAHATRVYDWLQHLGKLPIAVSDAPFGFLQRLGRAAGTEALALCREGLAPALVENATLQADMAVGAVTLAQRFGLGELVAAAGRSAKLEVRDPAAQVRDTQERVLFIQALEALHCLEEGVVASARDANMASVQGMGFPAWTGGAIQYVNHQGLVRFAERAAVLADRNGQRFAPPVLLLRLVADGASAIGL